MTTVLPAFASRTFKNWMIEVGVAALCARAPDLDSDESASPKLGIHLFQGAQNGRTNCRRTQIFSADLNYARLFTSGGRQYA
jgi:hypothetical protein